MSDASSSDALAIALFSEIFATEQMIRARMTRALPKGMELSHFILLNYLSRQGSEKSPVQLARVFNLTKGAMTNTLSKLEEKGFIHIRPDWDDARKKQVTISEAGRQACDTAMAAVAPVFNEVIERLGPDAVRQGLPFLRDLRQGLVS